VVHFSEGWLLPRYQGIIIRASYKTAVFVIAMKNAAVELVLGEPIYMGSKGI